MQIGLMIEGQDGLNWARWARILKAAEDFGYAFVFRSDHFANTGTPEKDSLDLWTSLTYAAMQTKRIEFGSLVTPVTFRHPVVTARMAANVDDLSGGRLTLGLGAGWYEAEHTMFGIPFYDTPTRHAMFAEALEITRLLFESETQFSFKGAHFSLDQALLTPRPKRKTPFLIGGNGPLKTLPLAAKYGDEWNGFFVNPAKFRELNTTLDGLIQKEGRGPKSVKRSLMAQAAIARDEAGMNAKLAEWGETLDAVTGYGAIFGTASHIIDQLGAFAEAGVERIMLEWQDLDDIDGMELLARDVLPKVQ